MEEKHDSHFIKLQLNNRSRLNKNNSEYDRNITSD